MKIVIRSKKERNSYIFIYLKLNRNYFMQHDDLENLE